MVILLYLTCHLAAKLWTDTGHSSNNKRRYIAITSLAWSHHMYKALPGFHAPTGSDYTSSFRRKRKVNPLKLAQKSAQHMKGLGNLGESENYVDDDHLVERYDCALHGQNKFSSIDEARLSIFKSRYQPVNSDKPLAKFKALMLACCLLAKMCFSKRLHAAISLRSCGSMHTCQSRQMAWGQLNMAGQKKRAC